MVKSERTRARERAVVPSYLTDQLAAVDRYGLTIDDLGVWRKNPKTGEEENITEYYVNAYKQSGYTTAQSFIAEIRYEDGIVSFDMNPRFTGIGVAALLTEEQFYARLAHIGNVLTRYGLPLDEVNDALFFYGLHKSARDTPNKPTSKRPVTSWKQAAAIAKLDLPWRLKEDLLQFHCDGSTLMTYEGINTQFIMELHRLTDPFNNYADGMR